MIHEITYKYGIEIRRFKDEGSPSGNVWIIDLMREGECIAEGLGVAPVLADALKEAADNLTLEIANEFLLELQEAGE